MVKWNSSKLKQAAQKSECFSDICRYIGIPVHGRTFDTIRNELKRQKISIQHFKSHSQLAKERAGIQTKWNAVDIFVENSPSPGAVKKRVKREHLLDYKCAICGLLPVWNGMPLTLQFDHINGKHADCRIENLRWLCANCHTQTSTYCGKSSYKKIRPSDINPEWRHQDRPSTRKTEWPDKQTLEKLIETTSWTAMGRMFGVSDNAVRKWARRYGLK
jgi:hypothetical protein